MSGKADEITWHAHIVSPETPWVAVVIVDNDLANRREITGTAALTSNRGN
jgi:hypothetical protein